MEPLLGSAARADFGIQRAGPLRRFIVLGVFLFAGIRYVLATEALKNGDWLDTGALPPVTEIDFEYVDFWYIDTGTQVGNIA